MRTYTFRKTVMLLTLLLVPSLASAQEKNAEERRGFIGLSIGPSAPFGEFAQTSSEARPRAGDALPGYTDTFLNVSYRFKGRLGAAVAFWYSEHAMRDGGDDDWYQVAGLTAGPMYSLPLSRKTALDLKAMIGFVVLTPVVDSYTTVHDVGQGPAVDVRATLRYDIFKRWALFAEAGMHSAGVSFPTGLRRDVRVATSGFGVAFRPVW